MSDMEQFKAEMERRTKEIDPIVRRRLNSLNSVNIL